MSRAHFLHKLPDDVLGVIFNSFLDSGSLELLSTLDVAYCSTTYRPWWLDLLCEWGVAIDSSTPQDIELAQSWLKWVTNRSLSLRDVDITEETLKLLSICLERCPRILTTVRNVNVYDIQTDKATRMVRSVWPAFIHRAKHIECLDVTYEEITCEPACVPWQIMFSPETNRTAHLVSLKLCDPDGQRFSTFTCPQGLPRCETLETLRIDVQTMDLVDLERSLLMFPNLKNLKVSVAEFLSTRDAGDLLDSPPLLQKLRTLGCYCATSSDLPLYLLRHSPNLDTAMLGDVLPLLPFMMSGRLSHLNKLHCQFGGFATLFLESTSDQESLWPQRTSSYTSDTYDIDKEGETEFWVMEFLRSLNLVSLRNFMVLINPYQISSSSDETFATFSKGLVSSSELSSAMLFAPPETEDEWIKLLQLPKLTVLEFAYRFASSPIFPGICRYCQDHKLKSNLVKFTCSTTVAGLPQLVVEAMPYLTSFTWILHNLQPRMEELVMIVSGLQKLETFEVESKFFNVSLDEKARMIDDVDWALRPPITITLRDVIPASWAVLKSLVEAVGDGLEHLRVIGVKKGDALAKQDKKFLKDNPHVEVTRPFSI